MQRTAQQAVPPILQDLLVGALIRLVLTLVLQQILLDLLRRQVGL